MSALRPMPVPRDAAVLPDGTIRLVWRDGHVSDYSAPALRRACPCATCVDEWTGAKRLDPATVAADLTARAMRRVGNYALAFDWSDGHGTGIYAFDRPRADCPCPICTGP